MSTSIIYATLNEIAYYWGITVTTIQGIDKREIRLIWPIRVLCVGFGGGVLRDLVLQTKIWLTTPAARPDILLTLLFGIFYLIFHKAIFSHKPSKDLAEAYTFLGDLFGCCAFLHLGCDKAVLLGACPIIAMICATVTTIGGGILVHGLYAFRAIRKSWKFYLMIIFCSTVYCMIPSKLLTYVLLPALYLRLEFHGVKLFQLPYHGTTLRLNRAMIIGKIRYFRGHYDTYKKVYHKLLARAKNISLGRRHRLIYRPKNA